MREELGVLLNEHISTMEAAEQPDDGIESVVGLRLTDSFQSSTELVIAISSDIVSSELALVHEVLEGHISVLLESDVILETLLNHLIHFLLQCKQLTSELNGVF
jgi:hypothetical protein